MISRWNAPTFLPRDEREIMPKPKAKGTPKRSRSKTVGCSAAGHIDCWEWIDTPEAIREELIRSGKMEDAAQRKAPLVLCVEPTNGNRGWHTIIPSPFLRKMTEAYDRDEVVYGVFGKTIRVWFDVVGITL